MAVHSHEAAVVPRRTASLGSLEVRVRSGPDGSVYVLPAAALGPYPDNLLAALKQWARQAPERTFLAERDVKGEWRTITYGAMHARVRRIAQALIDRGLSADRPLLILSGNSIDHATLALASMYVGVPYAPIAPAYSLQVREYTTLALVVDRLRPALIFADDGAAYERALEHVKQSSVEFVVSSRLPRTLPATLLQALESTPTSAVDLAFAATGPDTIAKILFTSGSTGRPKGVINTQRMLCSNQVMIQTVLAFLTEEPPVLCDWLPWNHTAGGNHNFGLVMFNGGTLYIDDGRPTPAGIAATVRNLTEIAATAHFTVPRTYEMLLPYLRENRALRERFFSKLKVLFYAAAGLSQSTFDQLTQMAIETCGEDILWMTGFGATETAPFAFSTGHLGASAGAVGLPSPGMEVKLAPVGTKLEARVRGPNVTPGYLAAVALTQAAFDEEGFYRMGDAMRFVDASEPSKGLMFDGRLSADFKLSTGTWVSVGPLRAKILARGAGLIHDVVIAGHDRGFVSALIFPNVQVCRSLCPERPSDVGLPDLVADPRVRERFQALLQELECESTGGSPFVARAVLLEDPPSFEKRELTDKGSLNLKAVLENRAAVINELYDEPPSARVITLFSKLYR